MRRAWRGAMPVALTLPLGLERRKRRRQTRLKRLAIGALILGAVLLAAGVWLPARAEIADLFDRVSGRHAEAPAWTASGSSGRVALPRIATLAIGDELEIEQPGGAVHSYEVTALDVVDSERAELSPAAEHGVVVLATEWPFDGTKVGGRWRYVVTARRVQESAQLVASSAAF